MDQSIHTIPAHLETTRLFLRPLTMDDLDFVFAHFSHPDVYRYLMDEPPLTSQAEAGEIIQSYAEPEGKSYNRWLVVRKTDGARMGTCGFHRWDRRQRRTDIGYDLGSTFWGQGYMSEALQAMLVVAQEQMHVHRVDAMVYVGNEPSLRLLRRAGFEQEGVLRDYFYWQGQYYDHALLARLFDES